MKSEFNFFKLLEDTAKGIISFIVEYLKITLFLPFRSDIVSLVLSDEKNKKLGPYSYYLISSYLGFIWANQYIDLKYYDQNAQEVILKFKATSLIDFLIAGIPQIVIIFLLTFVFTKIIKRYKLTYTNLLKLVLYALGWQYGITGLASLLGYMLNIELPDATWFRIMLIIIPIIGAVTILWNGIKPIKENYTWKTILRGIGLSLTINLLFVWAALAIQWQVVNFLTPNTFDHKIEISKTTIDENNLNISLFFKNNSDEDYILLDKDIKIYFFRTGYYTTEGYKEGEPIFIDSTSSSSYENAKSFDVSIKEWQDGKSQGLLVEKQGYKWLNIQIKLEENYLNELKDDRTRVLLFLWTKKISTRINKFKNTSGTYYEGIIDLEE